MNTSLKTQIKKGVGMMSVVTTAGIFLAFPALAQVNSVNSINGNARIDSSASSQQLFAQTQTPGTAPGAGSTDDSAPAPGAGTTNDSAPAPGAGTNNDATPATIPPGTTPARTPTTNTPQSTTGDSNLRPGSWDCLHNPNPVCMNPRR
ncbi:hypothetical protein NDI37_26450 [Funiculus sociatus GB2-A5]|jgi:hypothetical protein|uniref:Secreted protein n=1 Tax=Funiculus sociatus GB2-A5 TaxID=2933946 RepID=A0ABV0JWZ7_9CYAN|nr:MULTISPECIES: hypothetical protein [unclassified Trichocoleus]MBD1908598.1 hypothetical protein [Trichocoleus sp. FACHB-832]MBD1933359.1 hypothetical protein [Trichocoleus sp. FACHB-69]MBD2063011.1 hypothetical protein [Trichocoleus sp. FACHB-6]